ELQPKVLLVVVVFVLCFVVGVCGNSSILTLIRGVMADRRARTRRQGDNAILYIAALCVCDFLMSLSLPPAILFRIAWPADYALEVAIDGKPVARREVRDGDTSFNSGILSTSTDAYLRPSEGDGVARAESAGQFQYHTGSSLQMFGYDATTDILLVHIHMKNEHAANDDHMSVVTMVNTNNHNSDLKSARSNAGRSVGDIAKTIIDRSSPSAVRYTSTNGVTTPLQKKRSDTSMKFYQDTAQTHL
ncbi:hypothetical protein TELCIR_16539, partial [Teladorsagia circumcincta]